MMQPGSPVHLGHLCPSGDLGLSPSLRTLHRARQGAAGPGGWRIPLPWAAGAPPPRLPGAPSGVGPGPREEERNGEKQPTAVFSGISSGPRWSSAAVTPQRHLVPRARPSPLSMRDAGDRFCVTAAEDVPRPGRRRRTCPPGSPARCFRATAAGNAGSERRVSPAWGRRRVPVGKESRRWDGCAGNPI